jgi:outer membrane lipoprotein LolB
MSYRHVISLIIIGLFACCLSACARLTPAPQSAANLSYQNLSPQARQARLNALTQWHIRGALQLRDPQQSLLANYQWQQSTNQFQLNISSSLNLASVVIRGTKGHVELKASDGTTASAKNIPALLAKTTGWQLPIDHLYYWIRTLAAPGSPAKKTYDKYGHVEKLSQGPWHIQYRRYSHYPQADLPTLMRITGPNIQLKIAIKQWQLTTP